MSIPNLSRWAVTHRAVVLFLILAAAVAGLIAYLGIGRAEDPSFTIKVMTLYATWPGATAQEMQSQVAEKIEKKLQELQHFDYARTFCRPGSVAIELSLKDQTPPQQVADQWYQARKKIGDLKASLPEGVIGPFFDDEFGDVFVAVYAFTGEGYSPADLKKLAEEFRTVVLRVPDVAKVRLFGERPERIFIEFSHKKLASLGITPRQIFDSVSRQNAVAPAGSIDTPGERVFVRVSGALSDPAHLAEVPVESGGKLIRLGDVATISRGYEDPPTYAIRHDGQPAVMVGISMKKGANVQALGDNLKKAVEQHMTGLPAGVSLHEVAFQPRVVDQAMAEFQWSFGEALGIVLGVSFLSLGFRSGIVVAISVPLVLAVCFVVMRIAGMNFDRITLGALIISLGLLVDDAIIAVEMMVVKMEEGWDRLRAATYAWTSTAAPMLTGTLIIAAGFLPVGFADGATAEYAGNIFWVVGLALVVSWFVAVIFTPYLGVVLLPDYSHSHGHDQYDSRAYRLLRAVITRCVRNPKMVLSVTVGLLVAGMLGFTQVKQQFFPIASRPELIVDLRLQEGASFRATEAAVKRVEEMLLGDPDLRYMDAYMGAGPPRFYLALDPDLPNSNFAKLVLMTQGDKARERLFEKLKETFQTDPQFADLRGRVTRFDFGPPIGFPVQFRVIGPEASEVRRIAGELRDSLRTHPDMRDVNLDWSERSKNVRLEVNQDRARLLGLSPKDISDNLQTILAGLTISQYREGTETIDVVARAVPQERLNLEGLPDLSLITGSGKAIPLAQVADLKPGFEEPILWRRNREITLTVRGDVRDGVQAPDATAALMPRVREIEKKLPPGYRIDIGGAVEESGKANGSIFKVFPVMFLAMLALLMFQLQSFQKVFLVFAIAPLAIIGVTAGLLVFGAPFGFVALLGVISLAGMDMRNSVILMDQIDHDIESGMTPWQAVIESTVRRARPVVLTAAAAILAMIPLTRSVFWGPMAMAIMGGLTLATFLTLVNLPALYVLVFRVKEPPVAPASEKRETPKSLAEPAEVLV